MNHPKKSLRRREFLKFTSAAVAAGPALARFRQERATPVSTSLKPANAAEFHMPGNSTIPGPGAETNWPDISKYANTKTVPGMCQLCSTVCGIMGHVRNGRLIKIEGNPNDPNSRGRLCARGQAGLLHLYHPERLLYPLRRVGKRGEGRWKRISWDEALAEIAERLKAVRESGHPENFAFHQGRQRSKDILKRFLNAFGTKTQLSHRALCSGNRRAANLTYLWESDWDLNDVEHAKYILNFGSNAFEAHQGHIPLANRFKTGDFETARNWSPSMFACPTRPVPATSGFARSRVPMEPSPWPCRTSYSKPAGTTPTLSTSGPRPPSTN